ncbi:paraneoplastic antigen Ma1 homolog [Myxocyprinus asiaticus]|uniref:paraneoplastic antigen Ma1 homolog n=1 Tax=Myxocyprinus asiaticus TaxID=70543 RepID=UPI00222375C5|nr:paraneoplastic antigen Ma1 homolog [Myxocyprinus asiaticus]
MVNTSYALVLSGVPADADVMATEDAVQTVKVFGRVRVRGKKYNLQMICNLVLYECLQPLNPYHTPPEIISSSGEPWKTILLTLPVSRPDQFSEKISRLFSEEGKTMEDVKALFSQKSAQTSSPDNIIRAVVDLLEKAMRPTNNAFRCLRTFSGKVSSPPGEESLEHWLDQAQLTIEECSCSNKEKRTRIVECLKGTALEIVQAVRLDNPDSSPSEYLQALENVFGTSESGEDLYFAFRTLHQQSGEKLSDFLQRLERSLRKVMQRL